MPAAATKPDIVGWVDGASRGRLHGWALDRTSPSRRLAIAVIEPTGRQLLTLADRYRSDVHQSGFGDGHHGFSLSMRRLITKGLIRIVCASPQVKLGIIDLSPKKQAKAPKAQIFEAGTYTLQVDGADPSNHIRGWAVDIAQPGIRRTLQLRHKGRLIGRQHATHYRAEIVGSRCDGYHGFSFSLPTGSMTALTIEDVQIGLNFPIWI